MNSKKLMLLVVVMIGLLSLAGVASANTPVPSASHPPVCQGMMITRTQFQVTCQDSGKDIQGVWVESEQPLKYDLNWNSQSVRLTAIVTQETVFSWTVKDAAGNKTSGVFKQ